MNQIVDLKEYTDDAYLNYSMYAILDRALPHVGDGMKPVQRRLAYAMSELNLSYTAKYKKSARTIGDVLGKYHPHGDSACYGAMVKMAQPFMFRHPLVDGQGNWGSQDDPDSFAAMRYTEARLSPFANLLLDELGDKPVPFKQNFDGTMKEPSVLPAQLPMILLNGTSGIAVGMATDIHPHNLSETVDALVRIIDTPDADLDSIMEVLPGPDFPTTARIISTTSEIREAYAKGRGSIRTRCNYRIEGNLITITDLPYKVSGEKVIENIAQMITEKKQLPMIEDIQDHSDEHHPVQILIKLKKSAASQAEKVMAYLLSKTDLETSHRVNMNVIALDGSPRVLGLMGILHEWLQFRVDTVRKRTENQLDVVMKRLHLVDGMLTAFLNLDEVIRIIREEDYPKASLCESLGLTEIQADAILNTRLAKIAKLEEMELQKEQAALNKEKARLEKLLSSDANLKAKIREELLSVRDHYTGKYESTGRKSVLRPDEAASAAGIDLKALAPADPVRLVISRNGYVRSAKGHQFDVNGLTHKTGDEHLAHCDTKSNRDVSLLADTGRVYTLPAGELPSARGYGEPVTGWITPEPGTNWIGMLDPSQSDRWFVSGQDGYGFIAPKAAFETRAKKGKVLLNKAGTPVMPEAINDYTHVLAVTTLGRALIFEIGQLPELEKGKGVKLIGTKKGEEFLRAELLKEDDQLLVVTDKRPEAGVLTSEQWAHLISEERAKAARKVELPGQHKRETVIDVKVVR